MTNPKLPPEVLAKLEELRAEAADIERHLAKALSFWKIPAQLSSKNQMLLYNCPSDKEDE